MLRAVLPFRRTIVVASAVLIAASGWAATQLPSTFFPEIDESMERIYVRFAPGVSLSTASALINEMGADLRRQLRQRSGRAGPDQRRIAQERAQRDDQPEPRAAHGIHPAGAGRSREAGARPSARSPTGSARSWSRDYPGVDFLQWPGGLVASVFANGYIAPLVVEVRGDSLEQLDVQAKAVAEVATSVPGVRDIYPSLQMDYPEIRVETDRVKGGMVGVTARDAAQTTLEATLGNINTPSVWIDPNNGQSYYVVTSYDRAAVPDINALAQLPVRVSRAGTPVALGAYGTIRRSVGPDRHRAKPAAARRPRPHADRGAGHRERRARSGASRCTPTRGRATSSSASSVRSI